MESLWFEDGKNINEITKIDNWARETTLNKLK